MTPHVAQSDEDLAALAGHGDRSAFERLVGRHKASLFNFVRRYVGQADDAYDVLQDTFLAAWLAAPRFNPERPFLPWLRTIALNKCRDFGRRRSVRRLLFSTSSDVKETHNPENTETAEANAESDRLSRLDQAIAALPRAYKEPLLLTSVSGLSHQEAAAVLQTTAKAIEMRVYRAKRQLMEMMKESRE